MIHNICTNYINILVFFLVQQKNKERSKQFYFEDFHLVVSFISIIIIYSIKLIHFLTLQIISPINMFFVIRHIKFCRGELILSRKFGKDV
jgi:hypothetical protein